MTADAATAALLARLYHAILAELVRTGRAPHYTALARTLGITPEQARQAQRDLMALGLPNWLHPETDYIVGFAPFANLATQYAVHVDGRRGWYAECGFEALAVSWLLPG